MSEKEDFLPVCNNLGVLAADFQAAFCDRCWNPTCTRSIYGQHLFDVRAKTWRERLFENPKVLPQDDPRYAGIAAQKFQEIPTSAPLIIGQAPPTQAWHDPRDLGVPEDAPKPRKAKAARKVKPDLPAEPISAEPEIETPVDGSMHLPEKSAELPVRQAAAQTARQMPQQTPFQQGMMINGAAPPKPTQPKDSWAATPQVESSGPEVQVIAPGGKIRFGK